MVSRLTRPTEPSYGTVCMNVYALSPGSALTSGNTFSDVSKSSVPLSGRWITSDFATCPPLRSNERTPNVSHRVRSATTVGQTVGKTLRRRLKEGAYTIGNVSAMRIVVAVGGNALDQGRPGRHVGRAAGQRARDRRGRPRAARAGPRGRAHARQRPARRRAAAPERARRAGGGAAAAGRADRDDPGRRSATCSRAPSPRIDASVPVAALLTRVLVDPADDAFTNPTKPVGPFYDEDEAQPPRGRARLGRRAGLRPRLAPRRAQPAAARGVRAGARGRAARARLGGDLLRRRRDPRRGRRRRGRRASRA